MKSKKNCFSWTRLQRLKEMRWEIGAVLPSDVRQNLSLSEVCFFDLFLFAVT